VNITYKALCVMVKYEINFAAQDLYLLRIRTVRTSNYSVKGKVKSNVVKHVNRIRIGRRVIVRNSGNRNTNRKILPK
jgi:hypothetical protein